jgi:hypothetical protein
MNYETQQEKGTVVIVEDFNYLSIGLYQVEEVRLDLVQSWFQI